ncbi:RrF2 family transcriptional regulator [Petrocella sp. FN5]|uniref:RrF2 family transcriptional regulator n=1 Tax=Petrocella sp. FN5 TaxID=3032002 RepID=UPI0023DC4CD5|nr:Rrf2 family transcriptional regulator [Petrocella sp. FN5]MDF1617888.1 Rrf2 family transcriptional regulator [Petrocella sp. FN5]
MKISAKGRYAIVAMIEMAIHYKDQQTLSLVTLSERLDISKIYLEQVFTLLKKQALVNAIKGSHGGYYLSKKPEEITLLEIMKATEAGLFEGPKETASFNGPETEVVLMRQVYEPLDDAIEKCLKGKNLEDLKIEVESLRSKNTNMYYI